MIAQGRNSRSNKIGSKHEGTVSPEGSTDGHDGQVGLRDLATAGHFLAPAAGAES